MDTPNSMADAIENQIITLMIADTANFATIKVFDTEERMVVPVGNMPLLIVSITGQEEVNELTGNEDDTESGIVKYTYEGYIAVEMRQVDRPRIGTDRVAKRGVKGDIRNYLDAATDILELNRRLDSFVWTNSGVTETVRNFSRGAKSYLIEDRGDNLFNRGSFNIAIETHKR